MKGFAINLQLIKYKNKITKIHNYYAAGKVCNRLTSCVLLYLIGDKTDSQFIKRLILQCITQRKVAMEVLQM